MHRAVQSRGHYTDQASTLQRCFEIPKILLFISPPVQSICCFKPTKKTDFEHLWTAASKGWTLLVVHCKCVTGWVCSCHRIDLWLSQHWAHIFLVSSSTFRCCTVSDPISWNHSDYIRNNATVYWYGPPASQPATKIVVDGHHEQDDKLGRKVSTECMYVVTWVWIWNG